MDYDCSLFLVRVGAFATHLIFLTPINFYFHFGCHIFLGSLPSLFHYSQVSWGSLVPLKENFLKNQQSSIYTSTHVEFSHCKALHQKIPLNASFQVSALRLKKLTCFVKFRCQPWTLGCTSSQFLFITWEKSTISRLLATGVWLSLHRILLYFSEDSDNLPNEGS